MITVHPQYVVDAAQTRTAVLIPAAEWEEILEALEDLDDIQAYDAAKAEGQEAVPFAQALREIEQENQQ
jgi:PHD/YefM family antitoxin component YafN of YafNO toxin-antitoxin module